VVRKGSRDLLLAFWDPLGISGTVEVVTNIDHSKPLTKKCKIRSKGSREGVT